MSVKEIRNIIAQSLARDTTLTPDDFRKLFAAHEEREDEERNTLNDVARTAIELVILEKLEKGKDVTELLSVAKDNHLVSRCIVTPSTSVSNDALLGYIITDLSEGSTWKAWSYLRIAHKRDCLFRFINLLRKSGVDIDEILAAKLVPEWSNYPGCLSAVAAHCNIFNVKHILTTRYEGRGLVFLDEILLR